MNQGGMDGWIVKWTDQWRDQEGMDGMDWDGSGWDGMDG